LEEQIGQWIIIGIVVAFVAFDKARVWFNGKNGKYKYNPHPPTGRTVSTNIILTRLGHHLPVLNTVRTWLLLRLTSVTLKID
jgi:hypothetical protein